MQRFLSTALVLFLVSPLPAETVQHGLRLPDGFEVHELAGSDLANDIYCLTLDPQGRVIVSGRGYIRLLLDDDHDGRADRAVDFAGAPRDGAMGLCWDGDDLYCMGDGGLRRYQSAGGSGRHRPPELLVPFTTGGEHAAHAIRRGPDGWLYVLCGNNTGIRSKHASLPTSPLRDPVAGCVLRFPPDLRGSEIVADGFRNAYGFDFNSDGELFTYDSDNERCVSLPWYEPTRCYHVVSGGHYGWENPQHTEMWRQPPYFHDVVAPVAAPARGSPTGVVCYRHTQFPARYRGSLFLLDWTFGRIWHVPLQRKGSTYTSRPEIFLQSVGENGFAPTATAVDPRNGDLYVSIGGRGTRGAVYRIRYPAGVSGVNTEEVARLQPRSRSLDWSPERGKQWLTQASDNDLLARRNALEMIRRHRRHFSLEELQPLVQKSSAEPDRLLRQAVAALLKELPTAESERLAQSRDPRVQTTAALARPSFDVARLLTHKDAQPAERLDAVRIVQRGMGDLSSPRRKGTVWEGYSRRSDTLAVPAWVRDILRSSFPAGDADLDREISRCLALLDDDDSAVLSRVASRLKADSDPVEDIHYLIVLACLRAPRTPAITARVARALLSLDTRLSAQHKTRDHNWPLRVAELAVELSRKDSRLNAALLAAPEFGRPDHVLFTHNPGFDRRRAAEIFLERSQRESDFSWNAELMELLGTLPEERTLPVLRGLWGEAGLDDAILPLLVRHPHDEDRPRFQQALASSSTSVLTSTLGALQKLPPHTSDAEAVLPLLVALRRQPDEKATAPLRGQMLAYLSRITGKKLESADQARRWYTAAHPREAARLENPDGVDVPAWNRRLASIPWVQGDASRGRVVFTKASCASCHSGSQALGPDLQGVTGRFSRDDLFTAILQPSKDISPRYRTTQIVTDAGKVYQGMIIYEAVDSLILQTGPATTVRLTDQQVREKRPSPTSLMPAGLLDRLGNRDIADLYAYLRELKAAGPGR
jgi:putative heme-binding domain-containing protein